MSLVLFSEESLYWCFVSTREWRVPNEPVIRVRGLTKTYKEVQALKSLDLDVPRNSIFGFLGPNGAGKTTTIKLLLGLVRPTAGSAEVFGHDIVGDTIDVRRRTCRGGRLEAEFSLAARGGGFSSDRADQQAARRAAELLRTELTGRVP